MPADLLTQLERAGELLDRLALPFTIDEIVPASDRTSLGPTHDTQAVIPVEADGNAFTRRSASSLTWLRIAAATLLVAGGVVALLLREPDDSDEAGTTATTTVANSTTATSEELPLDPRSTEDWPPDAFPAGAVLRLSETLGPYGHVWVYDIPSDGSVCVVRKTTDSYAGCSVTDAETYRTGRAWTLEGDPQSSSAVLWGLAPVDMPITVTAGDATASSGPSGIWYLAFPAGVSDFTIVTPTATYTPSVTFQPLPTTTSPSDPPPAVSSTIAPSQPDVRVIRFEQLAPLVVPTSAGRWSADDLWVEVNENGLVCVGNDRLRSSSCPVDPTAPFAGTVALGNESTNPGEVPSELVFYAFVSPVYVAVELRGADGRSVCNAELVRIEELDGVVAFLCTTAYPPSGAEYTVDFVDADGVRWRLPDPLSALPVG